MTVRLSLLFTMLLAGCNTGVEFRTYPAGQPQAESTLVADPRTGDFALWAAREENAYPRNMRATTALMLAAIVDRTTGDITLYNFSRESLQDAKVWVNGQYGRPLDETLAPNQGVVLQRGTFHNHYSVSLSKDSTPTTRVEIQRGDELLRVQGPALSMPE